MGLRNTSRLAIRRRAAGFTQESLAEHLGCDRTTIGRWERGEVEPEPWNRRRLADALRITLDDVDVLLSSVMPSGLVGEVDRRGFLTAAVGGPFAAAVAALEQEVRSTAGGGARHFALRLLGHTYLAAGESAFDRLDLPGAEDQFRLASEVSGELADAELMANAKIQLGDVARRAGTHHAALRLLEDAESHARSASRPTRGAYWQTLARLHAEMGSRSLFEHAIGRAEEIVPAPSSQQHIDGEHGPWGIVFERAHGLTLLGEPAVALAIYDDAPIDRLGSDRQRGSFLIIRAQALALAGELVEGTSLAIEGLRLARGYGSARHVSRVQRMYDRLVRRWSPAEHALVDLQDALVA